MGVDYRAAIVVGLPQGDFDCEDVAKWTDDGELVVCPPYYDGESEEGAILGVFVLESRGYTPKEFTWDPGRVEKAKATFKKITGKEAKVWLSPEGY